MNTNVEPALSVEEQIKIDPLGDSVTSTHSITVEDGSDLSYTTVAGRMQISAEDLSGGVFNGQKPIGEVFVASYTLDGADAQDRPVVFAFNGGPGSPSLWLQFGLFGPKLVKSGDAERPRYAPYRMVDNLQTILTHADIVFIDPMTTGYSRPALGTSVDAYHGFSADRDLVADTIRIWTSINKRWLSPKFLAGESYGTTRSAALAGHLLKRYGFALNGVILISSILDFGTVFFTEGNDEPYIQYLPTYAATAHYHGKHAGQSLYEVVREAEQFAEVEYRVALARGNRLPAEEKRRIAERMAHLTGIEVEYVLRSELRLEHQHFFTELLRDQHLSVGRLDSRFTSHPGALTQEAQEDDPAHWYITQAYSAAANHYFRAELGYANDLSYEIMYGRVLPWSYKEFENASVTTVEDLAFAMRANPDFKVYLANGYYDGATPFAAAEHVFAHLRIPEAAYNNIVTHYYQAGHMMYLHEQTRIDQTRHIKEFIEWACGGREKPVVDPSHRVSEER